MKFLSQVDHRLDFELRGVAYHVDPRGAVEIPDRVAFAVQRRGLPLEPIEGSEVREAMVSVRPDDQAPPTDPVARLWWDRAHEMRAAADLAKRDAEMAQRHAEQAVEEQMRLMGLLGERKAEFDQAKAFVESVRAKLGLSADASVLEALDAKDAEIARLAAELAKVTAERDELLEAPADKPAPPPKKPR